MIGQTIGHYRVLEKIGEGGMGQVYLAEDTSLDRKVALKFLSEPLQQDPILRQRFLREAKLAAALDHPFICHIHEIGQADDGSDFIAMEFVEGQTLKERLQESPLSYREILQIGSEISEALERAHGKGIVHRDLKPANIMLTTEGRVKVMDFGLAKKVPIGEGSEAEITAALTKDQTTLGTLNYMSPEQLKGQEVDPRSDIFSFGIILYELLLGEHPFAGPTPVETVGAILNRDPQYPTGSQAGPGMVLHSTIQGMLAKDPSQRFQSIGEVRAELVQLREESIPRRRQIVWLAGLAALLIVAIAVVSLILTQLPPAPIEVTMRQVTSDGNPKLGVATDGSLVYFTSAFGDLAAGPVHVVAASGGKSEAVGTIEKYFEVAWPLDITPDGMKMLLAGMISDMKFRTLEDVYSLWIFPLPSGPPQRVGEVWASNAAW
ncbi:MAG: serine/threonine protein kinase, partial [Acidobacteriota bacterium]